MRELPSISSQRLAWLAGIIDGEGTITMFATKPRSVQGRKKVYSSRGQLMAVISISNTDDALIAEARDIIEHMGVKVSVAYHHNLKFTRKKPCWYLQVAGFRRVGEVLSRVSSFLVSKKPQSLLLLQLIRHRLKTMDKGRVFGPRPSFRDDEWLMGQLGELQSLNRRGPE